MLSIAPQTYNFASGKDQIKVHAISTGQVAVKKRYLNPRVKGVLGILDFLQDKAFSEWMPIWVWVIEHPEGIFVIDTGENSQVNDQGYFRSSGRFQNWFNTTQFKFKVDRDEEIDVQLDQIGIKNGDIKSVILSHLHLDHIDGLRHFEDCDIIVNRTEWERPYGDLPALYPPWFKSRIIDLDESFLLFQKSKSLTKSNDLHLIETPGHSFGHTSVLLKVDQGYIMFAIDVSYSQQQLIEMKFAAANADPKAAKSTYQKIKDFANEYPTVYLPSHEWPSVERLKNFETI